MCFISVSFGFEFTVLFLILLKHIFRGDMLERVLCLGADSSLIFLIS